MEINPPPEPKIPVLNGHMFQNTWYLWFQSLFSQSQEGFSGSFTNGDGDTVTVVNGKITDVS